MSASDKPIEPAHLRIWDERLPLPRAWTPKDAMEDALAKHRDCTYADWANGLDCLFNSTIVVRLWRNEECFLNDDPPK